MADPTKRIVDTGATPEELDEYLNSVASFDNNGQPIISISELEGFIKQSRAGVTTPEEPSTLRRAAARMANMPAGLMVGNPVAPAIGLASALMGTDEIIQNQLPMAAETAAAIGVGSAVAGLTKNPATAVRAGAFAGATASAAVREVLEMAGVRPETTVGEKVKTFGTEVVADLTFGKLFRVAGEAIKDTGDIIRQYGNALQKTLNRERLLGEAFSSNIKDFDEYLTEMGLGGNGETIVEIVNAPKIKALLRGIKPSKQDDVFQEIAEAVTKTLDDVGTDIERTMKKAQEISGKNSFTWKELGLDQVIEIADEDLAKIIAEGGPDVEKLLGPEGAEGVFYKSLNRFRLIPSKRKVLLKNIYEQKDRIARLALPDEDFNRYVHLRNRLEAAEKKIFTEELKTSGRYTDYTKANVPKDTLAETRKMASKLRSEVAAYEDIISKHPIGVDELLNLRRQLDKAAKPDKRSPFNIEDRINAEANLFMASQLRERLSNFVRQADPELADGLLNLNLYYGRLKRLEPLAYKTAAIEPNAEAMRRRVGEGWLQSKLIPYRSRFNSFNIGVGRDRGGAGFQRTLGRGLEAAGNVAIETGEALRGAKLNDFVDDPRGVGSVAAAGPLLRASGLERDFQSLGEGIGGYLIPDAQAEAMPVDVSDLISLDPVTKEISNPTEVGVVSARVDQARRERKISAIEYAKTRQGLNRNPTLGLPVLGLVPDLTKAELKQREVPEAITEQPPEKTIDVGTVANMFRRENELTDIN